MQKPHWIAKKLRDMRNATGLSLTAAAEKFETSDVRLGSYERGDRRMTLDRADEVLGYYGWKLDIVPVDNPEHGFVLPDGDLAKLLRVAADGLDRQPPAV